MARRYWPSGNAIGQAVRFPQMKDSPPYSPPREVMDGSESSALSPTRVTMA
jgi:hypothetical protein